MSQQEIDKAMADAKAEIARLKEENLKLKASRQVGDLTMKVSPKGAASVYGLQRFPVTLFENQWQRLLANKDQILAWLAENDASLAKKPVTE